MATKHNASQSAVLNRPSRHAKDVSRSQGYKNIGSDDVGFYISKKEPEQKAKSLDELLKDILE